MIAEPTRSVACTMICDTQFGRIWNATIFHSGEPMARADSTYSSPRTVRTAALATRIKGAVLAIPTASMRLNVLFPSAETTAMAIRTLGMDEKMSHTRMMRFSNTPPT